MCGEDKEILAVSSLVLCTYVVLSYAIFSAAFFK